MNSEIFVLYLVADRREMETERGRKEWRGRRKEWRGRRKKPAKISLRNGSTNACALFQFLLDGEVTKRHFSDSLGALPSISQHNRLLNPCLSEGTLVPERRHRRPIYCDGGRVESLQVRLRVCAWAMQPMYVRRERVLRLCMTTLVVLLLAIDALVLVFYDFHPR